MAVDSVERHTRTVVATSSPPCCPVCGCAEWSIAYESLGDRLHTLPGVFDIWRCGSCGLLRLWPLPSDLASCYPSDYYSYNYSAPERRGMRSAAAWHVRQWQLRTAWRAHTAGHKLPRWFTRYPSLRSRAYRELTRYAPATAKSLLDVGCGCGDFLVEARELGLRVRGIETSETAVDNARTRGLACDVGAIDSVKGTKERFDVIRLSHVLEHVQDPLEVLRTIVEALTPEGCVIMAVPNADGAIARLCREDWFSLDPPRHLWGFEPKNLCLLLDKAGLEVRHMEHASQEYLVYRSLCNLIKTRVGLTCSEDDPPDGMLSLCARIGWLLDPAGLGDSLVVVARRRD